jgi:hypothetical protein
MSVAAKTKRLAEHQRTGGWAIAARDPLRTLLARAKPPSVRMKVRDTGEIGW